MYKIFLLRYVLRMLEVLGCLETNFGLLSSPFTIEWMVWALQTSAMAVKITAETHNTDLWYSKMIAR